MYPGKVGRDHLGLGSVSSDQILVALSPGIYVLTIHPRYYSFYAFLLDEYWRRNRPRSRKAWVAFYRPREFIFSLGANLCDQPEHGAMGNIVGGQKTGPLAAQQLDKYDTTTHYIDSDLGGYGLYYRSVMIEFGLVYPGGQGFPYPVDIPSEWGKEIAAEYRRAIQGTTYYRKYFDRDTATIPIEVIREYIRTACLCQLQKASAPDRPLLLDTFLHRGNSPASRRATLRLLLDIASQTQRHEIFQHEFRQLLYFGATSDGARYKPSSTLANTHKEWRLYQAREYYAFALNALWYYLCAWGMAHGGDVRAVPLSALWQHLDEEVVFNRLAKLLQISRPNLKTTSGFRQLMDWLLNVVGASEANFDVACSLSTPINEDRLYSLVREAPTDSAALVASIVLLALIYLRFGHPGLWIQSDWFISQMGADGRLSVDGFVKQLRARLQRGPVTIRETVRWLFTDYIILQHQLVATSKLPDNTFRFQREGDALRFFNLENSLRFMDSRFDALSTTIHELGLVGNLGQKKHRLTSDGQRLLNEGDLT